MKSIDRLFRRILGLSFLPERVRSWLFGTGTRILEVMNFALMAGCAILIHLDDGRMFLLHNYLGFYQVAGGQVDEFLSASFAVGAALALTGIVGGCRRARRLGGFALLVGAFLWGVFATGFYYSAPPVTTAVVVYSILSLFCWIGGEHLMAVAERLDRDERESEAAECSKP